jgi:hypothetical protein
MAIYDMFRNNCGLSIHYTNEYHLLDMASSPEKKVIDETNSDDDVLAQLGYTQGSQYYKMPFFMKHADDT